MLRLSVLLVIVAAIGCSRGKGPRDGYGSAEDGPSTTPLWAFAPADATMGLVVADDTIGRYLGVARALVAALDVSPVTKNLGQAFVDDLTADLHQIRILEPASWKKNGLDPDRGFAVFADARLAVSIVVLPVGDRDRFRKAMGGKEKRVGKLTVDEYAWGIVCAVQRKRYLCAETVDRLKEQAKQQPSPVRAQIELLTPALRGDVELHVAIHDMPQVRDAMASVGALEALTLSARLGEDRLTVRGWIPGALTPQVLELVRGHAPLQEFQKMSDRATTVVRGRVPADWLEHYMLDLSDSFSRGTLGGDFQLLTVGGGTVSGAMMFTLRDPAAGAQVLGLACAAAELLEEEGEVSGELLGEECEIRIDLATKLGVPGVPPLVARLAASDDVLTIRLGSPNLPVLGGTVVDATATSDLKKLFTEPQTLALWTRHPDVDIVQAFRLAGDDVPQAIAETSAAIRWLLAHVHQMGLGINVSDDGIRVQAQVITFAGDPPAARTAYFDLVKRRLFAGSEKEYIAGRAALARAHPATRIAERMQLEDAGVPSVGLMGLMGSAVSFYWLMSAADQPEEEYFEAVPEGEEAPAAPQPTPTPTPAPPPGPTP